MRVEYDTVISERDEVHSRLAAREGELSDLVREGEERAAAAEQLKRERAAARAVADDRLASLNTALSKLAHAQRIERELRAVIASLGARDAALSSKLAAARHVNEAMLAALRDPPAPPSPPPREMWLTVLLRRVGLRTGR
jgi:hypothetical protein